MGSRSLASCRILGQCPFPRARTLVGIGIGPFPQTIDMALQKVKTMYERIDPIVVRAVRKGPQLAGKSVQPLRLHR
jgi:hypothetical protein